jgi:hypothetical protein
LISDVARCGFGHPAATRRALVRWHTSNAFYRSGRKWNDGGAPSHKCPAAIPQRSINPDSKSPQFIATTEDDVSKEPKIEHEYHAHKDRLTITIQRYSLKSKKTRDAILMKLMANLESKPDRLTADEKKQAKKGPGKKLHGLPKNSRLVEVGD